MKNTEKAQANIDPLEYRSIFAYFKAKFKITPAGKRFDAVTRHFKKYLIITRVLRYIRKIVVFIETSAFFIIYATIFIILIPLILLLMLIAYIFSLCRYAKYNKIFTEKIIDSKFTVYFWNGDEEILKEYISSSESPLQENEIILIAHSGSIGTPLLAVKEKSENIYHISMGYFYSLKKHVLDKNPNKVTYTN